MARIVLPIMIVVSLALGVLVGFVFLYIYPYEGRAGGGITQATATQVISIPAVMRQQSVEAYPAHASITSNETREYPPTIGAVKRVSTQAQPFRIYRAEIINITQDGDKIYLRLVLSIEGGTLNMSDPRGVFNITRITLNPSPFPLGWNGSSWVYGSEEARCVTRIPGDLRILSYSYMAQALDNGSIEVDLELVLNRDNPYGPYNLSIILKMGAEYYNIYREIDLGGYRPPITSPPREIAQRLFQCH